MPGVVMAGWWLGRRMGLGARLTLERWREPNVGMDPTLRIDRRNRG